MNPLTDDIDRQILMHRDAHFSGNFAFMIDYYEKKGKGAQQEFELKRIYELAQIEKELNQNLASEILGGADAEQVALAKKAYKMLRDLYENDAPANRYPKLIADLILTEEEEPQEEITKITNESDKIVPELLQLIRSEDFHNPLFPGYGHAPTLAAKCLGLIGDKRAIISLFESIGDTEDFFDEDISLEALRLIGDPAKEFLLNVVKVTPYNEDNERAAIALNRFKDDPEVASTCFEVLKELTPKKDPILSTYLILNCEGLEDKEEFLALANQHPEWKQDILAVVKAS